MVITAQVIKIRKNINNLKIVSFLKKSMNVLTIMEDVSILVIIQIAVTTAHVIPALLLTLTTIIVMVRLLMYYYYQI